ncbi:MAG: type II secretion system protein [Candidatus Daviesbacteria bacterium]|nr:MAG: type II secretion system protein [Candidatus Daviesbacteria bacterium]
MNKGYTLVELLVVMTILSLIGLTSFINLGNFREDKLLDTSLTNLQSLIRKAQSDASTGLRCSGVGGATWSVEFKDRKSINLNCKAASQQNATTVSVLSLGGDIQIQSISGDSGCQSSFPANSVTVNLLPVAAGMTFIDPTASCISTSKTLNITLSGKTGTRTVNINKGGSIN